MNYLYHIQSILSNLHVSAIFSPISLFNIGWTNYCEVGSIKFESFCQAYMHQTILQVYCVPSLARQLLILWKQDWGYGTNREGFNKMAWTYMTVNRNSPSILCGLGFLWWHHCICYQEPKPTSHPLYPTISSLLPHAMPTLTCPPFYLYHS